jgi:hypothetical protein
VDCAGVERAFTVHLRELPDGYHVEAREETKTAYGYRFEAFAADPIRALGELRKKLNRALAQKYLRSSQGSVDMAHDEASGWIGYDGLVIDGTLVEWEDLKRILLIREGFSIRLQISSPSKS